MKNKTKTEKSSFFVKHGDPTGYTPCEPRGHFVSDIALRCARGAICARSLECEHSDSASLDYVAFGSNRSGEAQMLDGPPAKKRDNRKGYLSFAGGPSRTRTLDRPVMSR